MKTEIYELNLNGTRETSACVPPKRFCIACGEGNLWQWLHSLIGSTLL